MAYSVLYYYHSARLHYARSAVVLSAGKRRGVDWLDVIVKLSDDALALSKKKPSGRRPSPLSVRLTGFLSLCREYIADIFFPSSLSNVRKTLQSNVGS